MPTPNADLDQGPAIYAYNDGQFTAKDFESIQHIGDSRKKVTARQTVHTVCSLAVTQQVCLCSLRKLWLKLVVSAWDSIRCII